MARFPGNVTRFVEIAGDWVPLKLFPLLSSLPSSPLPLPPPNVVCVCVYLFFFV